MIEIRNLSKSIYSYPVINDLSLTIKKGTIFGFLGQNGAGKTTTMKMLVGLNTPTSGSIRIGNHAPSERAAREHIGFMPESPSFYDHLTAVEFLTFCSELFDTHTTSKPNFDTLLKDADLFDSKKEKISTFSKGMKQRLAFAQAIVGNPTYLFLDEPLDGLDPIGRRALKGIVTKLRSEGKTIFFNSHILSDVEEICDEIGILHKGRLLYSGSVQAFTNGKSLEKQFVSTIEQIP